MVSRSVQLVTRHSGQAVASTSALRSLRRVVVLLLSLTRPAPVTSLSSLASSTDMTTKTVFQTDAGGVYLGETVADESPLEPGVWLLPAGCVEVAPPEVGQRQAAVFDGDWKLVPDWRGVTLYSTADGAPLQTSEVGKTPADLGATEMERPSSDCVWGDGVWVVDAELRAARARQIALAHRDELLGQAAQLTSGLADAYLTGLLSADEDAWFKAMAAYKRDLSRIELAEGFPENPAWPTLPPRPY